MAGVRKQPAVGSAESSAARRPAGDHLRDLHEQCQRNHRQQETIASLEKELDEARRANASLQDTIERLCAAARDQTAKIDTLRSAAEIPNTASGTEAEIVRLRQRVVNIMRVSGRLSSERRRAHEALVGLAYRLGEAENFRMEREHADAGELSAHV